jgi:hypothetical protein
MITAIAILACLVAAVQTFRAHWWQQDASVVRRDNDGLEVVNKRLRAQYADACREVENKRQIIADHVQHGVTQHAKRNETVPPGMCPLGAPAGYRMTGAHRVGYEALKSLGWLDTQLLAHGFMVKVEDIETETGAT